MLDVNECETGICDLTNGNCTNNPGSYECSCHSGFEQNYTWDEFAIHLKRTCIGQ